MMPHALQSSLLSSWGICKGRRRTSESPYIESVWEGTAKEGGIHFTAADATIDLVCLTRNGTTRLLLSGPTSKMQVEILEAGDEVLTIRLCTSVYLPFMAGTTLTDVDTFLSGVGGKRFWLHGGDFAFPNFENAETFIEHLAVAGLLKRNLVLEDALEKQSLPISKRAMRRYCLATVGLTLNCIQQIKRAEQARGLLATDYSLTRIAYDVGYSNPGHMTNAFKYFFGRTPSAFRKLVQQEK